MQDQEKNNYINSLDFVLKAAPDVYDSFIRNDLHRTRALINEMNIVLARIHARLCHEIDQKLP